MKTKIMLCSIVLLLSMFTGSVFGGTEGQYNTFYGQGAGASIGFGTVYDTFIGGNAGYSNSTGSPNTFVGYQAGDNNTIGNDNTFIGAFAGFTNIEGDFNTFVGVDAGFKNTGGSNTFVGLDAGHNNTIGNYNSFIGRAAGVSNDDGEWNTFVGVDAGFSNIHGLNNTFVGGGAGHESTGSGNVFLGFHAGYYEFRSNQLYIANSELNPPLIYGQFGFPPKLTINGNLEVIGPDNGIIRLSDTIEDLTTKGSRMVLHHYSNAELPVYLFGAASTATDNFVAFGGGNPIGNAATQIDLFTAGNTTTPVGTPRLTIKGNGYVGIGTQFPSHPLQMAGGAYSDGGSWVNGSSRDYKDDIESLSTQEALETIKDLNPVKYAYKTDRTQKRVGFIAEDVPDLVATKDRKGLSPIDIVAVLTKVVQEQQGLIKELQQRLLALEDKGK